MEAERSKRRSSSVKRKPLSDLTNSNLIPNSTLRKLRSSSSLFSKPSNPFSNPTPTPCPIEKSKPNPDCGSKPYGSSAKKTNSSVISNSFRSDTSIGSSNFDKNVDGSAQILQPHPSTHPSPPPPTSSTSYGDHDDEILECPIVYSRRLNAETMKNKGKAIAVPLSLLPMEKINDKGKEVAGSFTCPAVQRATDKGKAVVVPLSLLPMDEINDKGKAIAGSSPCSPMEKTKDKGKALAVPLSLLPMDKLNDKGKAIAGSFSCPSVEKAKDKGKAIALPFSCLPLEVKKDKGKTVDLSSNLRPLGKPNDIGKVNSMPVNCPPLDRPKGKKRAVSVPFSCPPLPRIRNELIKAGDIELSKSTSDPHQKHKKKRRCGPQNEDALKYSLSKDFIERQRAYFREVDEFELPEEEISDDELDK